MIPSSTLDRHPGFRQELRTGFLAGSQRGLKFQALAVIAEQRLAVVRGESASLTIRFVFHLLSEKQL
jgi:hypothetical protein